MSGRKELIEYRTPNTKHFLKRDGTIEVEIYKDPVHYLDKGEYKEIDNSLVKTTKGFKNKSNDFKIEFDEKDNDSLVNISCKNKKLSMFPKNINQKISNRSSVKKPKSSLISNSISYESMYEGVDIDYKVLSNQLKESIILNKIPKENKFVFVINTDLNLILNDDNTISFIDKDKECYKIEKPYMVDKNNIYSDSVTYELEKIDNGYEITINVDKEWLNDNERAYPIVIDPTITNTQSSTSSVIDTYIYDGDVNMVTYNKDNFYVGADKSKKIYRSLLKFDLPKIPVGFRVTEAYVRLSCYPDEFGLGYQNETPLVSVHRITCDWDENTAKWANMNDKYSNYIEDYYLSSRRDATFSDDDIEYVDTFQLTNLVQKWYNGDPNYGIMLKEYKEVVTEKCRPAMYISKDAGSTNSKYAKPLLVITYKNFNGLESYLSYTSNSHYFGTYNINNYTGNLTLTFNVAKTISNIMNANLYLVYNTMDIELNHDYGYGLGIKPNLVQTIEFEIVDGEKMAKYLDEDGTIHYFYTKNEDEIGYKPNIYYDEDGLGLSISCDNNNCYMTDKNFNVCKFVNHVTSGEPIYYLEEIKDLEDHTIKIIYENNKISKIRDASNDEINITYMDNKITFNSPQFSTVVNLTNNLIESITSLGNTETLIYNQNKLVEKIIRPNGLSFKFEYINQISYKVRKISEVSKLGKVGNYLIFNYSLSDTKIVDNRGHINTYIFNNYGNVVGVTNLDEDGNLNGACGKSYSFGDSADLKNKLVADKSLIKYVDNLIDDSSFESGESLRFKSTHMDNTNIASKSYSRSGEYSLEVEIPRGGESVYKEFKVEKGKKYTFSAYIKGMSYSIEDESPLDLFLYYDNSYEVTHISGLTDDFVRYSVSIDYNINAIDDLKVVIRNMSAGPNGFYIDDMQLEEGEVANYYNLVDNSGFKNGKEGWVISGENNGEYAEVVNVSSNIKALKVHSEPQGVISVENVFNISGKKGDTFNLSFWYKNGCLYPSGGEGLMPGTWATIFFHYDDSLEYGACVPSRYLNMGSDNWQFFSENFVAEANYTKIEIHINSFGGANDFYVTNFTLFKDLESYSYDYDENGNLVASTSLNKKQSSYKYENNQLIEASDPQGLSFVYEYDNKVLDRIINTITPSGITNHIDYDQFGNPVKVITKNRNVLSEIKNEVYFIRAKGTNKYFYVNPDKTLRLKESECSYDKFCIIPLENDRIKIKHAILDNYYVKVINDEVKLMYGDTDNIFQLISNSNKSYTIKYVDDEEINKVLTVTDTYNLIIQQWNSDDYHQEFFFENTDSKLFIELSAKYTTDGKYIKSVINSLGDETKYDINTQNGKVNSITDSNNSVTNYVYDENQRIIKILKDNQEVCYEYDSNNNVSRISHGKTKYSFDYDEFNEISVIKVNGRKLIDKVYDLDLLTKIIYGNSQEISYSYDDLLRIKELVKEDNTYQNFYDNLGRLIKITSSDLNYKYSYDFAKRLSTFECNDYVSNYNYNDTNNIIEKDESLKNIKNVYYFNYNEDSYITSINTLNNDFKYVYDELGRLIESNINDEYRIKYSYITKGNKTSYAVGTVDDNGIEYSYSYDKLGNIVEIKKDNILNNKYYYDAHSQLIKEDDIANNLSKEYSYDNSGNILSKKVYVYNTSNLIKEDKYEYTNNDWQDLLTKFNNEIITYDEIGNPTSIGNAVLNWINGRELSSYSNETNTIAYKYNSDGVRISKMANGIKTKYYVEGRTIIFEDRDGLVLYYIYNGDELLGFKYNDVVYYYHKNILGDIVGILDSNYNELVTYEYDSWGCILSITDNSGINLGEINPFRYRSYYYDSENKLYYLGSRYYNPEIGRFINSDNYITTDSNFIGFNMFSYANNNFINCIDKNGRFAWPLVAVAVGIVVLTVTYINFKDSKKEIDEVREKYKEKTQEKPDENFRKTLTENAATVKSDTKDMGIVSKSIYIAENTKSYSKYDLKRTEEWKNEVIYYDDLIMEPQDLGNYHFGYICRAAGLPLVEMVGGAGLIQFKEHTFNTIKNCPSLSFCDDPRDTYYIIKGAQAYDEEHRGEWLLVD